jgi:hypothetical protein
MRGLPSLGGWGHEEATGAGPSTHEQQEFESQPTETQGLYEHTLKRRLNPPSGRPMLPRRLVALLALRSGDGVHAAREASFGRVA